MDWLMALVLLVVGGCIGYFVAKFVNERKLLSEKDKKQKVDIKELMTQRAMNHVQDSKYIAEQLRQQADALSEQIASFEEAFNQLNTDVPEVAVSFFGEHASAYLRHTAAKPSKEKTTSEFQPLDFASQSSGLFSGSESKKIKPKQ
jgi:uncharacterized protein